MEFGLKQTNRTTDHALLQRSTAVEKDLTLGLIRPTTENRGHINVTVNHRCSHCGCRMGVRTPPIFWTWVFDAPTFCQFHYDIHSGEIKIFVIQIVCRNMGLLKHFKVILVYTLYNSFNYIPESSSIWSHTGRHIDLYIPGWTPPILNTCLRHVCRDL